MKFEIRKLSKDLLEDWLSFFDKDAFADNGEWCGCYCMCYHWNQRLNLQRPWGCDRDSSAFNRKQAIAFIKKGRMQGYLAYAGGKVVGWCNANSKACYDNVNFNFAEEVPDNGRQVKSVVCFTVVPPYRGQGVATALLERVCEDAKAEGFDMVEAYPFAHDENHAYHGPVSLFEKSGFRPGEAIDSCVVYRKELNPANSHS